MNPKTNHLTEEEIGCLIDGTMGKHERKKARAHLSVCDSCLHTYTQTKAFLQREHKRERMAFGNLFSRFPMFSGRRRGRTALQVITPTFVNKGFRWAAAAILIVIVSIPFFLRKPPDPAIKLAKENYIKKSIMEFNNRKQPHGFGTPGDKEVTAIRLGFFVEELAAVVKMAGDETDKLDLEKILIRQLKYIFKENTGELFPELGQTEPDNIKKLIKRIRNQLQKYQPNKFQLHDRMDFGRFVEHSILETFAGKLPEQKEIRLFLLSSEQHRFPIGVMRKLGVLKTMTEAKDARDVLNKIKSFF